MRRLLFSLAICITFLGCSSLPLGGSSFDLMSYKESRLKNGLPVLLIKDKNLPYISYIMMVQTGSVSDPPKLSGLSSMVASLLEKGTNERSATEIAESLGQIGAEFSTAVMKDYSFVSASGLSFHQERLLKDFSEIVTQPAFSSPEIQRVKKQTLSSLQRSVDDPGGFAGMIFDSLLYGNHPYGSSTIGNMNDVRRIRKKNIIRHYLTYYRPNNAYLAVVGNFDSHIMDQLNSELGDWSSRKSEETELPQFPPISGIDIELIDKSGLQQTQIRFGHKGIKRTSPDFLPLRVANTILGGAFASRLVDEIREKRGLTYSIYSSFDARKAEGPFVISTFTRHDKVKETIQQTLNVLQEFKKQGVSETEVKEAKALLKGTFPRALETPEAVAQNLLILRYYGIPDSYLTDYLGNIDDISVAEVNDVIKKHLDPENMKILVYSSKSKVAGQLKPLGDVKIKSYKEFL